VGGNNGRHAQSGELCELYGASTTPDPDHPSHWAVRGGLSIRLTFWRTGNTASAAGGLWLLGADLIAAAAAAIAGLIDFLGDRRIRDISDAWQHAIGNVILVLVQLFGFYQRYRYGASMRRKQSGYPPRQFAANCFRGAARARAVAGRGQHHAVTGWKGGELVFRHRVAVYDEPRP